MKRAPQALIHGYDSWNWKRGPLTWKAAYIAAASPNTASDQTSVTVLASPGLAFGSTATTPAPTNGSRISTLKNGKPANIIRPPVRPRRKLSATARTG